MQPYPYRNYTTYPYPVQTAYATTNNAGGTSPTKKALKMKTANNFWPWVLRAYEQTVGQPGIQMLAQTLVSKLRNAGYIQSSEEEGVLQGISAIIKDKGSQQSIPEIIRYLSNYNPRLVVNELQQFLASGNNIADMPDNTVLKQIANELQPTDIAHDSVTNRINDSVTKQINDLGVAKHVIPYIPTDMLGSGIGLYQSYQNAIAANDFAGFAQQLVPFLGAGLAVGGLPALAFGLTGHPILALGSLALGGGTGLLYGGGQLGGMPGGEGLVGSLLEPVLNTMGVKGDRRYNAPQKSETSLHTTPDTNASDTSPETDATRVKDESAAPSDTTSAINNPLQRALAHQWYANRTPYMPSQPQFQARTMLASGYATTPHRYLLTQPRPVNNYDTPTISNYYPTSQPSTNRVAGTQRWPGSILPAQSKVWPNPVPTTPTPTTPNIARNAMSPPNTMAKTTVPTAKPTMPGTGALIPDGQHTTKNKDNPATMA